MANTLNKRQFSSTDGTDSDYNNNYDSWWWSPTGMAVRYAVITVIFVLLLAYFLGGYIHAKRRVAKGLPPLAYHRWMANRRAARYNAPPQQCHSTPYYQNNQGDGAYDAGSYGMQGFPPPPPAYDAHTAPPPVYQPPQGGNKIAADQNYVPVPQVERVGESSAQTGVAPRN